MYKNTFLFLLFAFSLYAQDPVLTPLGTYRAGAYNAGAAEIVAHDPATQRLFVVNGSDRTIDVLDMSVPSNLRRISQLAIPAEHGRSANSVAVKNGIVAVAVERDPKTNPGSVVFFDTQGRFLSAVQVGALPDMIAFTPDGKKVLTANEAEPSDDYTIDPEGSISIIDISRGAAAVTQSDVKTAGFTSFTRQSLGPQVRIYGPRATPAQDIEPEYIAISPDSKTAWVTLQENNALAIVDIDAAQVTRVVPLGVKDHWRERNTLDASDRDNAISLRTWTVWGMYLPDGIATYAAPNGKVYLLTANEGDARAWTGYNEERRVSELRLDPRFYPNEAELKLDYEMGRLRVTGANGDEDGDGDYDFLYTFGARSFSVWDADGRQVYDSGNDFEVLSKLQMADSFNISNSDNTLDGRSDDKGPEPEAVVVGTVRGRSHAFIANERQGNILIYDLTNPQNPRYAGQYWNRNPRAATNSAEAGDLGPEGLAFIAAGDSPTGRPLLAVANEISGTTTVWQID